MLWLSAKNGPRTCWSTTPQPPTGSVFCIHRCRYTTPQPPTASIFASPDPGIPLFTCPQAPYFASTDAGICKGTAHFSDFPTFPIAPHSRSRSRPLPDPMPIPIPLRLVAFRFRPRYLIAFTLPHRRPPLRSFPPRRTPCGSPALTLLAIRFACSIMYLRPRASCRQ